MEPLFLSIIFLMGYVLTWQFAAATDPHDFYQFTVKDMQGNDVSLEKYRGTVSLVVNVASKCGFTDSHYNALPVMQKALGEQKKFQVLAFPCNQFGKQEPGTHKQIMDFVKKYEVNFPIFAKIDVIGPNADPIYRFLAEQTGKAPEWNFWKYLVDMDGRVVKAWPPRYEVDMIFDEVWRQVTKAGGEVKSTLSEDKEL